MQKRVIGALVGLGLSVGVGIAAADILPWPAPDNDIDRRCNLYMWDNNAPKGAWDALVGKGQVARLQIFVADTPSRFRTAVFDVTVSPSRLVYLSARSLVGGTSSCVSTPVSSSRTQVMCTNLFRDEEELWFVELRFRAQQTAGYTGVGLSNLAGDLTGCIQDSAQVLVQ